MAEKGFYRGPDNYRDYDDRPDPHGDFLDWVLSIVETFGGDPIEGGFADPRVARH